MNAAAVPSQRRDPTSRGTVPHWVFCMLMVLRTLTPRAAPTGHCCLVVEVRYLCVHTPVALPANRHENLQNLLFD